MVQLQPVYLHKEFKPIVQAVSAKLLPQLKAYDDKITAVHYQYGHPLEIIKTLGQYDQGGTSKFNKYPLVAFFLDMPMDRGADVGIYGEATVHMAIIRSCKDPNHTAEQRDVNNFDPVLTPIYMELMRQIGNRGDIFQIPSATRIRHKVTYRYYWGKQGLFGNETNIFNDWVDCIEIENLKLKINENYCPKPAV